MEDLYALYLSYYIAEFDDKAYDYTKLERLAALALARLHRETKSAPLTFYDFGLAWDKLRNTAPVK